jgi:hypothetical protein
MKVLIQLPFRRLVTDVGPDTLEIDFVRTT